MKKSKKTVSLSLLVACIATQLAFPVNVFAAQIAPDTGTSSATVQTEIPDRMEPDTIIRYTSPTQYIIVQGGSCDETAQKELNALLAEKQKYLNEHQQEIQDGSLTIIKSPTPVAGMVVKYDGEGYQKEITPDTENHAVNDSKVSLSAYRGHYAANGNYSWGSHSNRMKITSSTVSGSGRFTNFTDTIGDHNNYLKKGDVATKGAYDNPPSETAVTCTANRKTVKMYKNDNGGLPDACLDIWKYGTEYFGVTWHSYVSIDHSSFSHPKA